MPEDPDNPTSDEDIVLSAIASEITYSQETTAKQYDIKEGVNIVSFDFIITDSNSGAYMASDVMIQAKTNNVDIKYISTFDGGRWYEAYSCTSDTCTGTDFSIVPGRGYLIYANNSGSLTIPGYNLKSSIPVAFSSGWNLVGIHGYTTAYTARTLIDSINKIDGLTANNVSWWPTSKGKYEGLQVENNTEYGLDFAISPTNGYFVRISEFAPSDTTCKSILWNDGGTLNGTCGNTK
jgi:putative lipoic acid-binding regulatory protein